MITTSNGLSQMLLVRLQSCSRPEQLKQKEVASGIDLSVKASCLQGLVYNMALDGKVRTMLPADWQDHEELADPVKKIRSCCAAAGWRHSPRP